MSLPILSFLMMLAVALLHLLVRDWFDRRKAVRVYEKVRAAGLRPAPMRMPLPAGPQIPVMAPTPRSHAHTLRRNSADRATAPTQLLMAPHRATSAHRLARGTEGSQLSDESFDAAPTRLFPPAALIGDDEDHTYVESFSHLSLD